MVKKTNTRADTGKIKVSSLYNIPTPKTAERLAIGLCTRMDKEISGQKSLSVKNILALVGAGVLSLMELYPHNIYKYAKPYLRDPEADIVWERFNIPYLKRKLERLEKQKIVEIENKNGKQIVKLKEKGRLKLLKFVLNDIKINTSGFWNGKWWLVSYDLPEDLSVEEVYHLLL